MIEYINSNKNIINFINYMKTLRYLKNKFNNIQQIINEQDQNNDNQHQDNKNY
jgi:hypothetical protein